MLKLNEGQVADKLDRFIWSFRVGRNIVYNFKILFFLYKKKEESLDSQKFLLNKPIIINIVSIIEGIFCDFVWRLDSATNHFPKSIDDTKRESIKARIEKEKRWDVRKDFFNEKDEKYKKVKNYTISDLIELFREYELLGSKEHVIYENMEIASYLRNRTHIFNYHQNFEIHEDNVFNEDRLLRIESLLCEILDIMVEKHGRPFQSGR